MRLSVRRCRVCPQARGRAKASRATTTAFPRLSVSLSFALVLGLGCALSGQYRDTVEERDDLAAKSRAQAARIAQLEASSASLESALADAYEKVEDLRIETVDLTSQIQDLEKSQASLGARMKERSFELIQSQSRLDTVRGEVERLTSTYGELMEELESEVSAGQIQIDQLRQGIRVAVSDEVLFASGSADLDPLGREVIGKVSRQLASLDYMIEVQGHTDDHAITRELSDQFASNWDLAAARAAVVVRQMERHGVRSDRLSLTSFASHRPIVANDSPAGRSQNRRIEIRLRPRGATTVSEQDAAPQLDDPGQ